MILYVPFFNPIFSVAPLSPNDWILVFCFSVPVIFIDEVFFLNQILKLTSKFIIKSEAVTDNKKKN